MKKLKVHICVDGFKVYHYSPWNVDEKTFLSFSSTVQCKFCLNRALENMSKEEAIHYLSIKLKDAFYSALQTSSNYNFIIIGHYLRMKLRRLGLTEDDIRNLLTIS